MLLTPTTFTADATITAAAATTIIIIISDGGNGDVVNVCLYFVKCLLLVMVVGVSATFKEWGGRKRRGAECFLGLGTYVFLLTDILYLLLLLLFASLKSLYGWPNGQALATYKVKIITRPTDFCFSLFIVAVFSSFFFSLIINPYRYIYWRGKQKQRN